jgi:hypothetical protein
MQRCKGRRCLRHVAFQALDRLIYRTDYNNVHGFFENRLAAGKNQLNYGLIRPNGGK